MAIFFNFSPGSNHLHSLQVENCDSNSQLVVDEHDNSKIMPERVKALNLLIKTLETKGVVFINSPCINDTHGFHD